MLLRQCIASDSLDAGDVTLFHVGVHCPLRELRVVRRVGLQHLVGERDAFVRRLQRGEESCCASPTRSIAGRECGRTANRPSLRPATDAASERHRYPMRNRCPCRISFALLDVFERPFRQRLVFVLVSDHEQPPPLIRVVQQRLLSDEQVENLLADVNRPIIAHRTQRLVEIAARLGEPLSQFQIGASRVLALLDLRRICRK